MKNKFDIEGKLLLLSYDQGLEHGPTDFNDENVDPNYIIDIAKKGKFSAVVFQKGIAEKYNKEIMASKVPLLVKLNGKTNLFKGEPISEQMCSVSEAVDLGASAVGYTLYIGSEHEDVMLSEFGKIEEEAHAKGLVVVAWIYPRGKSVEGRNGRELMAYAARTGLEIGADVVKLKYEGGVENLRWAVKSAGKTKVVVAGGIKKDEKKFFRQVEDIRKAGASGLAIGRNVWQSEKPLEVAKKIREVLSHPKVSGHPLGRKRRT